jgi:hypothetical protein
MIHTASLQETSEARSLRRGTVLDVRSVEGGMSAWRGVGHPVETGMHETSSR